MLCESEADLNELRREMAEAGYIRSHLGGKRERREEKKSKPLHFVSSSFFTASYIACTFSSSL